MFLTLPTTERLISVRPLIHLKVKHLGNTYKHVIVTFSIGFIAIKSTIVHLVVSNCGRYLVCAGTCCNIAVYKSSKKSGAWKHHINLPKYNLAPTAIALHHNSPLLVAAFSDSKVMAKKHLFLS